VVYLSYQLVFGEILPKRNISIKVLFADKPVISNEGICVATRAPANTSYKKSGNEN